MGVVFFVFRGMGMSWLLIRLILIAVLYPTFWVSATAAQNLVRPTWSYSAVCPGDYDYVQPWCRLRGYTGDDSAELERERSTQSEASKHDPYAEQVQDLASRAWTLADRTITMSERATLAAGTAIAISAIGLFVALRRYPSR